MEEGPVCKKHKKPIILICKTPKCNAELLCLNCITTTHNGHQVGDIDDFVREIIGNSKETLGKIAKMCRDDERKQLIKWLNGKKREIEAEYEEMIVQLTKVIIEKRNIHLQEIEQFLTLLQANINPQIVKTSKELINEGNNIITQSTLKKYGEVQRISQNITNIMKELEPKMKEELKDDKSKLRAKIEEKISQQEKEIEEFSGKFFVQFKGLKGRKEGDPQIQMENYEAIVEVKEVIRSKQEFKKESKKVYWLCKDRMYIYDVRGKSLLPQTITFNGVKKNIPVDSRYIEEGGNIYLCGGYEATTTSLNRAYICKEKGEFMEISPMQAPREQHTLVSIYPHYIYAIGGCDRGKRIYLSSCEVLDLRSQSWSHAPQLLKPKCRVGGCSFDNRYIYIFGGWYNGYPEADIDFLDTSLSASWGTISLTQQNVIGAISNVASAQIGTHNIIIYGGIKGGSFILDKSFILDLNTMKITHHYAKLKESVYFNNNNNPVIYGDKLYNIGGNKQDIHIFDLKSLEFDIIPENIWKK